MWKVVFGFNNAQISSRLLEGDFPEYEKIIPTQVKTKVWIDKQDFLSAIRTASVFAKEAKKYNDCIRDIKAISIKKKKSFIYIDIEANGFLRSMARNIVSFLVKIGKKDLLLKNTSLILSKKIKYTNKPAPASGLYLYKVIY